MVWHRFACGFDIGLHAGSDDKEMVCMLVYDLREMVWMRYVYMTNWFGFWSIWIAVGLHCANDANHGKPITMVLRWEGLKVSSEQLACKSHQGFK